MNTEKENSQKNKRSFVIIYILGFVVSVFFELYWINYFPYDYFMLFGIGAIICFLGYLSIDGILEIVHDINKKKEEQNELLLKASKAIYLATKKNSMDADKKQLQNLKALDAIINHAVENFHTTKSDTDSQTNINNLLNELSETNARLSHELENVMSLNSLVKENELLVNNAKEVLENVSEQNIDQMITKDVELAENMVSSTTIDTSVAEDLADITSSVIDDIIPNIPVEDDFNNLTNISAEDTAENISFDIPEETMTEAISIDIPEAMEEHISSDILMENTFEAVSDSIPNDIPVEDVVENISFDIPEETMEESISFNIPEEAMDEAISINIPETMEEAMDENISSDILMENTFEAVSDSFSNDIPVEDVDKNISSSDKQLSPEEISALFANL